MAENNINNEPEQISRISIAKFSRHISEALQPVTDDTQEMALTIKKDASAERQENRRALLEIEKQRIEREELAKAKMEAEEMRQRAYNLHERLLSWDQEMKRRPFKIGSGTQNNDDIGIGLPLMAVVMGFGTVGISIRNALSSVGGESSDMDRKLTKEELRIVSLVQNDAVPPGLSKSEKDTIRQVMDRYNHLCAQGNNKSAMGASMVLGGIGAALAVNHQNKGSHIILDKNAPFGLNSDDAKSEIGRLMTALNERLERIKHRLDYLDGASRKMVAEGPSTAPRHSAGRDREQSPDVSL